MPMGHGAGTLSREYTPKSTNTAELKTALLMASPLTTQSLKTEPRIKRGNIGYILCKVYVWIYGQS